MKRVTGLGGVFFVSENKEALAAWYRQHLGIDVQEWCGAVLPWNSPTGTSVWSIFDASTKYFSPGSARFMVNFRVDDLHALLAVLREEGCNVVDDLEESEYGKFGWVIDPDGNKVELWEPPAGQ